MSAHEDEAPGQLFDGSLDFIYAFLHVDDQTGHRLFSWWESDFAHFQEAFDFEQMQFVAQSEQKLSRLLSVAGGHDRLRVLLESEQTAGAHQRHQLISRSQRPLLSTNKVGWIEVSRTASALFEASFFFLVK